MSLEGLEGGKSLQTCPYHYETSESKCFHGILQNKANLMENNIICGGSITGSHLGIVRLLDIMLEYMGYLDSSCLVDPFIGQILLQMIIYQYFAIHPEELDLFVPDNFYSPTFTMGYVPNSSFHIDDNFVIQIFPKSLNGASRVPPYIHQYDRHPILENAIKQKLKALDTKDLSLLPISIVMILFHTLESYIKSNLLEHVFECLIYLQEISDEDIEIIETLSPKFKILGSSSTLHQAYAIDTLFNAASMPFILLLENDWEITVDEEEALVELRKGIKALTEESIDVYQLRFTQNTSFPLFLYGKLFKYLHKQRHSTKSKNGIIKENMYSLGNIAKQYDILRNLDYQILKSRGFPSAPNVCLITPYEQLFLYTLALHSPGNILEEGSYCGCSTIFLAAGIASC